MKSHFCFDLSFFDEFSCQIFISSMNRTINRDGQSLVIARIDGGGLLDQWNRKLQGFPTHQVALGDRIISVNSVAGDMENMRNELRCDSINMRVLKDL